jgi:hypothetical protein
MYLASFKKSRYPRVSTDIDFEIGKCNAGKPALRQRKINRSS